MTTKDTRTTAASDPRRELGRRGEEIARDYLIDAGAVVLDTNWRCREGEIDLVVVHDGVLVVVEVKTRRSARFGRAAWAVTEEKYHRLRRLAGAWMDEHDVRVDKVRVDVIGIEWYGESVHIDHRAGVTP